MRFQRSFLFLNEFEWLSTFRDFTRDLNYYFKRDQSFVRTISFFFPFVFFKRIRTVSNRVNSHYGDNSRIEWRTELLRLSKAPKSDTDDRDAETDKKWFFIAPSVHVNFKTSRQPCIDICKYRSFAGYG